MKNLKKIMALVIAMVMILGTMSALTVSAATTQDTSISVEGLTVGDVVTPYQVVEWVGGSTGWAFTSAFSSLTAADLKEITGDPSANPAVPGKISYDLAKRIAALASGGTAEAALTGTTWTKDNPDPGLYMILVAAAEPGTVYNPIFVSCDFSKSDKTNTIVASSTYSDNSAVAKKKKIEVKKTTSDTDKAIAQAIDSYVGELVDFNVETTIPVFLPSYKNPSFVIDDAIKTAGIELQTGTVSVKLNGTTISPTVQSGTPITYECDQFTLVENGTTGYTITFKEAYLKGNSAPVEVEINYKGKITNTAEFNVNEDDNEVTITYASGPNNEKSALRDRTNHYTFSLGAKAFGQEEETGKTYELIKVGVDEDGNPVISASNITTWRTETPRHPLSGAKFGLYTDAGATTLYTNDIYPNGATFTTGADGIITFKGLAEGTYYLKEISAPGGYIMDTRVATVVIDAVYKTVDIPATTDANGVKVAGYQTEVLDYYTVTVNNSSVYDGSKYGNASGSVTNTYNFDNHDGPTISNPAVSTYKDSDMVNTEGIQLPSTGGMGTTLFYVIGAVLVIGAGILLVTRRRMSAN